MSADVERNLFSEKVKQNFLCCWNPAPLPRKAEATVGRTFASEKRYVPLRLSKKSTLATTTFWNHRTSTSDPRWITGSLTGDWAVLRSVLIFGTATLPWVTRRHSQWKTSSLSHSLAERCWSGNITMGAGGWSPRRRFFEKQLYLSKLGP